MKKKHVKNLLSDYLDEVLAPRERGRVKKHLGDCKECAAELKELKTVSKLVSSLPRHDLPEGFQRRLQAKRRELEVPAAATPWLPMPARLAAFAMTGLLVCAVFYRQVRYRLAPTILPEAASITTAIDREVDEAFPKNDLQAARKRYIAKARAKSGAWRGLADEKEAVPAASRKTGKKQASKRSASGAKNLGAKEVPKGLSLRGGAMALGAPSSAGAAASAPRRAALSSAGGPVGQSRPALRIASNEEGKVYLDKQAVSMGIRDIIPAERRTSSDLWQGSPNRPLNRAEMMRAVRQRTRNLQKLNEQNRWAKSPTVPLDNRRTPRIIGDRSAKGSRPMNTVGGRHGTLSVTSTGEDSIAYTGFYAREKLRAKRKHKTPVGAVAEPAAPKPIRWTREWSGQQGGMSSSGAALIKEAAHWTDLFERVRFAEALPAIDFSKEMAIGVFADPSPTLSRSITIASIKEEGGRLMIRYRVGTDLKADAPKPSAPYHIVIVPRSGLTPSFAQVP